MVADQLVLRDFSWISYVLHSVGRSRPAEEVRFQRRVGVKLPLSRESLNFRVSEVSNSIVVRYKISACVKYKVDSSLAISIRTLTFATRRSSIGVKLPPFRDSPGVPQTHRECREFDCDR